MEPMNVYVARLLPGDDYVVPGHRACQGCGEVLAMRLVHKALGRNTVVASATGCMEIISSSYPDTAWAVPWIHVAFENAAAVASGIEAAHKVLRRKGRMKPGRLNVVAMGGDGATADIGLQALSGAFERGHDIICICYDNEAYMNTGIQRSSSTPYGASTTTSPAGKVSIGQQTRKKNMVEIAVAHEIPYAATANPSYPIDLVEKVRKASRIRGPKYLHIYSGCPTGWRSPPNTTIQQGRLATQTGFFPLYEVEHGRYRITMPTPERLEVSKYLETQGRFRHLFKQPADGSGMTPLERIQKDVDATYERLERMERMTNPGEGRSHGQ
jgi:pyruvate ferredoxin oxidoreductase beta subunit